MPTIPQIRGAFLEEIILYLLKNIGYEIVTSNDIDVRDGHSGIEVQGRGEWHQIDAFAKLQYTPAFMYPLRLILEAKCYKNSMPVGIGIVRNSVGVLKDITENYFTFHSQYNDLKFQRFNYHSAIFSTSGYTKGAQNYALAHQVFLIQYENISLMHPISNALLDINTEYFNVDDVSTLNLSQLRKSFRSLIDYGEIGAINEDFSDLGNELLSQNVLENLFLIQGSYFGMLQGKYPMHLISELPLPPQLFENQDQVECRIIRSEDNSWAFASLNDQPFFNLEFDLPEHIADVINSISDRREIANQKKMQFSYIDITGKINGVFRMVKLKLDQEWLNNFLNRNR